MSFPETQWSELAAATLEGNPAGRKALESMCAAYRPCLVDHLRFRGIPHQEVEDIVQETFEVMLSTRAWNRADPRTGKFRSFLLGILQHILSRRLERSHAAKRGGGDAPLSLDHLLDGGFEPPAEHAGGDLQYDRQWALRMIELAMKALRSEWDSHGRGEDFKILSHFLPGAAEELSYEAAAAALGGSGPMVKSAVHRLRSDFRQSLRRTVAQTVSAPHEIDEELRHLREILSKPS